MHSRIWWVEFDLVIIWSISWCQCMYLTQIIGPVVGCTDQFISRGILRIKPTYVCRAYMLAIEHIRASLPHMCVESEHICSYETIYAQFWIQPYVQKFTRICSLSTHICGSDARICSIASIYALQTYVGLVNVKSPYWCFCRQYQRGNIEPGITDYCIWLQWQLAPLLPVLCQINHLLITYLDTVGHLRIITISSKIYLTVK